MNSRLVAVASYIVLPLLIAGAWFVWRTSVVPHLVFGYIRPFFPDDAQARAILGMLAISAFSGLLVGASFGVALGLLVSMEKRASVTWIGCGAIVVTALWSIFVFSQGGAPVLSRGYFMSGAFEMATFMASLVLASYATRRFAAGLSARSKSALGFTALVCALLVYYEMFRILQVV
jgi:hypothetical protein